MTSPLFEMFIRREVLRRFHEDKARVMAAMIARRKVLPVDASYLMRSGVLLIMSHAIDA